jgi:signal transduction histidine kinase
MQEPIHKIQVFADIISQGEAEHLSDKSRITLQKIIRAAQRLKQLTANLQRYLNVEDDASISEVSLNEVIERAKSLASDNRNFDDFDFIVEPLPAINGYERQLELMFYNLIDNSIQFRDPGTKLRITITGVVFEENVYKVTANKYKFSKHLKLIYRDNGTGFEPQYSEYIFELLKKIHTDGAGLGIGMSLVKKIAENHFGSIEVESKPNEGSTFVVILPVRDLDQI